MNNPSRRTKQEICEEITRGIIHTPKKRKKKKVADRIWDPIFIFHDRPIKSQKKKSHIHNLLFLKHQIHNLCVLGCIQAPRGDAWRWKVIRLMSLDEYASMRYIRDKRVS